jgi:4-hydroxy-tetrahydrodipicolinate synthase
MDHQVRGTEMTPLGETRQILRGILPVLPAPFDQTGQLLLEEVPVIAEWAIQKGVHGLTVNGVASEVFRLDDRERVEIIRAAVQASGGRVPVVAGAGGLATRLAVSAATDAVEAGADALLVPPPPVGTASTVALANHYADIARAVSVPIILQDDPVHLGVGLTTEVIIDLAGQFDNIRYGKLEELPSISKIREVIERSHGGVSCLGGSGGLYALEELAAGAVGLMTGFVFPEALVAIYEAWQSGERDRARTCNLMISGLTRLEALPKIALSVRKHLYVRRGVMSSGAVRSPGVEADPWTLELAYAELAAVEAEWKEFGR